MKQLSPVLARGLFYALACALFAWSCSLTMKFLGDVLPHVELAKYMGLALFDLGALSWLFVFLKASQGMAQRAIALTLSLIDLAGAVLIGFAQIMLGGQSFAEIPADLGTVAIWSIAIWTGLNLFSILGFHLVDPAALREMSQRAAKDKILSQALDKLDRRTDEIAGGVADSLAEAWQGELLLELDALKHAAPALPANVQTIDGQAKDPEEPKKRRLFAWTPAPKRKNGAAPEPAIYQAETEKLPEPTAPKVEYRAPREPRGK
jgi:hypothetical protein